MEKEPKQQSCKQTIQMPSENINSPQAQKIQYVQKIDPPLQPEHMDKVEKMEIKGNTKFRSPLINLGSILNNKNYSHFFDQQKWDLSDTKFNSIHGRKLFQHIEQANIIFLYLDYNKYPGILKNIRRISFPILKQLNLGDNCITSISVISLIKAPLLQKLRLNDNPITQFKNLRKCKFPKLKYLSLRQCKINSSWQLCCLIQLNCPLLETLVVSYTNKRPNYNQKHENILNKDTKQINWLHKTNWLTKTATLRKLFVQG